MITIIFRVLLSTIVLLVLLAPAQAQPALLEPGFKLQAYPQCGHKYVTQPGVPRHAYDAKCSPAETWGKELLYVARQEPTDDFSGSIETIDRHGSIALFGNVSDPSILAFEPPATSIHDYMWIGQRHTFLRISPAGAGPILLDGSGSSDPDSRAGTRVDIVAYEWYEQIGGSPPVLLGSGVTLPVDLSIGAHAITLVVTDAGGLSDSDSMLLTIQDTTAPELEVQVSPGVIWVRDGQIQEITATVGATDLCGAASFLLKSVASSEPDDSGGGATAPDFLGADYGTPDLSFMLRAERDGTGPGRIYTITYEATDEAGNRAESSAIVTVPHDQRD